MKSLNTWMTAIAAVIMILPARGASVVVDWLTLPGGSSPSAFSLLDDNNAPLAGGKLIINQGASFLGTPVARTLGESFWGEAPGYNDSVTTHADVTGISFRVAAVGGSANYAIEFTVPVDRPMIIVIGDLFRNSNNSAFTAGVTLTAASSLGSSTYALAEMQLWDPGVAGQALDQSLDWNSATGTLSTVVGSDGNSKLAFFYIDPIQGTNPTITLSVPTGQTGTGDTIFVGVGAVVPEPSAGILAGLGVVTLLARRRRC